MDEFHGKVKKGKKYEFNKDFIRSKIIPGNIT